MARKPFFEGLSLPLTGGPFPTAGHFSDRCPLPVAKLRCSTFHSQSADELARKALGPKKGGLPSTHPGGCRPRAPTCYPHCLRLTGRRIWAGPDAAPTEARPELVVLMLLVRVEEIFRHCADPPEQGVQVQVGRITATLSHLVQEGCVTETSYCCEMKLADCRGQSAFGRVWRRGSRSAGSAGW